jgi:RND superfamily putative drug exporter
VTVVALLLLLTYRSPWLWLVPLAVIGLADQVAARLVNLASTLTGFVIDPASLGITSVLVFGAGTNYALLLIARYREELRRYQDRHDAMRAALREAAPAILASSSTVVLALLSLSLAHTPANRVLGYAGAIGIATAVAFALVLLPAVLLIFPRGLFWPFVPRAGDADATAGIWGRVGRSVTGRPLGVTALSTGLILLCAFGLLGVRTGLSQNEQFRVQPEAVAGQEVLARTFAGGFSQPTVITTSTGGVEDVLATVRGVAGVQSATRGPSAPEVTEIDAILKADPASSQSRVTIAALRQALAGRALVGGPDAEALDNRTAAARDARLIIPVILGIVLVVLLLLLRSVVAPVLLLLTVVATYAASMGVGWLVFDHLFDFPALDLSVPLLAFLFLVALGVDYNIFLTLRAREEARQHAARQAIVRALAVTGGVITSAGVLLASVFAVLGVLPLITLTQLGIIVGFGVLLDTLVVRSLLVPALVTLVGERFWWPSHPGGVHADTLAENVGDLVEGAGAPRR